MALSLSVLLDSYGLATRPALESARRDGFSRIEAGTLAGDLRPSELSASGRRHLLRVLRDHGLSLSGLTVEHPGAGLSEPNAADQRLHDARQSLELAADLGVRRTSIRLAGWTQTAGESAARQILGILANDADRYGLTIAVAANDADLSKLSDAVDSLASPGLGIVLPSTAAARTETDLARAARLARAVRLRDGFVRGESWEESPLGSGQVDFRSILAQLATADYAHDLTLQRDAARRDVDALRRDRDYMQRLLGGEPR